MSRRRYYDSWYPRYPKSTPREAKGGIKAQSKRGAFGESWWAGRWISVLESFNIGARLQRGRSYARRGQVLSIDIGEGKVKARVQGSRPKPYEVTIQVKTLSEADWRKVADIMAGQAIFAAKLLAGEMPKDIEEAFKQAKLSLFPAKLQDLSTDCSCPDWSNPCKHIAAVYYLLGEEFDRDPFLIFRLRGIERKELVGLIGGRAHEPAETAGEPPEAAPATGKKRVSRKKKKAEAEEPAAVLAAIPAEPLPSDPSAFWGEAPAAEDLWGEVRIPSVAAALPRRLGSVPLWRAEANFLDTMEAIYRAASPKGMDVFLGQAAMVEEPAMPKSPRAHVG